MVDAKHVSAQFVEILVGPLKGGVGTVISFDDCREQIIAIVEKDENLTPPLSFHASQCKTWQYGWRKIPFWVRGVYLVLIAFGLLATVFRFTPFMYVFGICWLVLLVEFARLSHVSRRIKTCPACRSGLDPDTWSVCKSCRWVRPVPEFLDEIQLALYAAPLSSSSHSLPKTPPTG